MRRTWIVVLCLAAVGAAVFTDNMDEMYRCANADISVVVPGELAAGGTGSIGVLATDMDGVPVEGKLVRVAVISPNGVEEFFGVTGPDGMASVDLDVPQVEGNVTVTVTVDGRLFTGDLRVTEAPPPAIIIQTDKPVYHPGQTVHMRFLVLDGIARRPVTEPVTVSIITPDGDRILEREIPAGRFGVSALDFALSGLLPLGEYLVVADVAGGSETRSFLVDRYVLPRFAIFADGLAPWYTPGDAISFDIVANYTFGRPVSGTIAVDVFGLDTTSGWVTFLDTLSGPLDGRFALRTDVGAADGFDTLLFNVTVTDDAGHEEHETLAAGYYASPLTLTVIGDRNVVGLDSICRFIVTYPDGSPARATLDVSLYEWIGRRDTGDDGGPIGGARTPDDDPDDEGGGDDPTGDGDTVYLYGAYYGAGYRYLSTTTVETDARGIASVSFEVTGAAMFMEVNVTDGETVARYPFDLWAADDGIKVIPNQLSYGVGETATFTVISSGGVSGTGFYDVYTCGRHLRSGVFDLGGGTGTIAFTVDPEMVPGFEIRATRVTDDLRIASSSAVVAVSDPDALTVTVVPSGGTYRPGEEVTVDVRTTSGDAPVIAALGVRAVDASVLELAGRMSTE
ncbi:MAG TPA: hypothetical protein EYP43_03995, partial [Thermoplasmata archaeon]|nr:hypothetical protein [Thermoplasmata archaeon]